MEYTEEWLEYWSDNAAKVEFTYCPSCGQESMFAECDHCGYDIATYYERELKAQAHEVLALPQDESEW